MRRFLWTLVGMMVLSYGLAQTPGLGFYSSSFFTPIGVQYQSGILRLGLGPAIMVGGIGGDVAFILGKDSLSSSPGPGMIRYHGFGLGVSANLSGRSFVIFPHGFMGTEVQLPDPAISTYLETGLGVSTWLGDNAFVIPFAYARVGVILR